MIEVASQLCTNKANSMFELVQQQETTASNNDALYIGATEPIFGSACLVIVQIRALPIAALHV